MANYFKFYTNWQKAKDYDRLDKENEILRNQFNNLKDDVRQVEDYAIGMLTDAPDVHPRLSEIIDVISDYKMRVSDLSMQINRLKSQLQKRDKKTGRFLKK
jgi:archaellum component FlaC